MIALRLAGLDLPVKGPGMWTRTGGPDLTRSRRRTSVGRAGSFNPEEPLSQFPVPARRVLRPGLVTFKFDRESYVTSGRSLAS